MKNSKKHVVATECSSMTTTHYGSMELPAIVNMDDLAVMHDDELYVRARGLDADRWSAISAGASPYDWEVEMAYVCRELQLRHERHNQHMEYLAEVQKNGGEVDWTRERMTP